MKPADGPETDWNKTCDERVCWKFLIQLNVLLEYYGGIRLAGFVFNECDDLLIFWGI